MPTEPAPKVSVPKTDVPFLDTEAIADPEAGNGTSNHSADPGINAPSSPLESGRSGAPASGPPGLDAVEAIAGGACADCAKYARIGYVAGVVVGVSAGALVAYVILRNRLAPVAE